MEKSSYSVSNPSSKYEFYFILHCILQSIKPKLLTPERFYNFFPLSVSIEFQCSIRDRSRDGKASRREVMTLRTKQSKVSSKFSFSIGIWPVQLIHPLKSLCHVDHRVIWFFPLFFICFLGAFKTIGFEINWMSKMIFGKLDRQNY